MTGTVKGVCMSGLIEPIVSIFIFPDKKTIFSSLDNDLYLLDVMDLNSETDRKIIKRVAEDFADQEKSWLNTSMRVHLVLDEFFQSKEEEEVKNLFAKQILKALEICSLNFQNRTN